MQTTPVNLEGKTCIWRAKGHKLREHNLLFVVLPSNVFHGFPVVWLSCTQVPPGPKLQPLFKRLLNVGSLWRSSMKLMAKLIITHRHQYIELSYVAQSIAKNYQHTSRHHQEKLANNQRPPKTTRTHPDTTRKY